MAGSILSVGDSSAGGSGCLIVVVLPTEHRAFGMEQRMAERDAVCVHGHPLSPGRVTVFARTTLLICVVSVAVVSAGGGTAPTQNESFTKHRASSTMTRST